jgi:hypothetical protein
MSALILFGWAAWVGFASPPPERAGPPEGAQEPASPIIHVGDTETQEGALERATGDSTRVISTHYTCEPVAANPMFPCGLTRDGSDPATPGMACPLAWLGRVYRVEGFGALRCDDTGAHDYLRGLPHIDIRVPTLKAAIVGGIVEREIWRVE